MERDDKSGVGPSREGSPVMTIGGTMTAIRNHGRQMSKQSKKIVEHIPKLRREAHTVAQDLDHLTWTRTSSQHERRGEKLCIESVRGQQCASRDK